MLVSRLEQLTASESAWGLLEKHRVQYFLLTVIALAFTSLLSFLLLILLTAATPFMLLALFTVLIFSVVAPVLTLFISKRLKLALALMLLTHFLSYQLIIFYTGYFQSPAMLNLFYLPLIALLAGDLRFSAVWTLLSLISTLTFFSISHYQLMPATIVIQEFWYQISLTNCVWVCAMLALAYEKTIRDMLQILDDERQDLSQSLERDDLTGAYTMVFLQRQLVALTNKLSAESTVMIIAIDIEGFAHINSRYGYHTGDEVLKLLVQRLSAALANDDMLIRIQQDDFAIVAIAKTESYHQQLLASVQHVLQQIIYTRKHEITLVCHIKSELVTLAEPIPARLQAMFTTLSQQVEVDHAEIS